MALKDTWIDKVDDVNGVFSDDINSIAQAVIKNEEDIETLKKNSSQSQIPIDTEMSDTSENPVQNKVVKEYVDTAIQEAILDSWEVAV